MPAVQDLATGLHALKSNTIYRVDFTELAAATQVAIRFEWYEDLGV